MLFAPIAGLNALRPGAMVSMHGEGRQVIEAVTGWTPVGRDVDDGQRQALRRFNGHPHRIEVLTFDHLSSRRAGRELPGASGAQCD